MQFPITITHMWERPFQKMSNAQTSKERKERGEERRLRETVQETINISYTIISENKAQAQPGAGFNWHRHKGNRKSKSERLPH